MGNLGALKTGGYNGGRKNGGYSLRQSLEHQGVTTEEGMQRHLSLVTSTLAANKHFDITSYRVDPNNPNGTPLMG